jgi:hypothetical protein
LLRFQILSKQWIHQHFVEIPNNEAGHVAEIPVKQTVITPDSKNSDAGGHAAEIPVNQTVITPDSKNSDAGGHVAQIRFQFKQTVVHWQLVTTTVMLPFC